MAEHFRLKMAMHSGLYKPFWVHILGMFYIIFCMIPGSCDFEKALLDPYLVQAILWLMALWEKG